MSSLYSWWWFEVGLRSLGRASVLGGAALLLVWALCRALPRLSPRVRCWLWRLAYLKLLVVLVWGAPLVEVPLLPAAGVSRPAASPSLSGPQSVAAAPEPPAPGSVTRGRGTRRHVPRNVRPDAVIPAAWTLLLLLWVAGVGWSGGRVVRQWRVMRRIQRESVPLNDEALTACCRELCRRFGLRRTPCLLLAPHADGPLLVGVRRPAILLPPGLLAECSPGQVRLVLAHELAHLRRRDLLWNWLAVAAQTLLFFHPLVWMAGREWRLAQEMAADEAAVLLTDAAVADYGALLVRVAARRAPAARPGSLLTVGVIDSPRTLKRRLVAMKTFAPVSPARRSAAGAALLLAAVAGLVPWRAVAQQQDSPPAAPAPVTPAPPAPTTASTVSAPRPAASPKKAVLAPPPARTPVPKAPVVPVVAPQRPAPLVRPAVAAPVLRVAAPVLAPVAGSIPSAVAPVTAPVAPPPSPSPAQKNEASNLLGQAIGERIAARMEALGEQLGKDMEARGEQIGALAEQLQRTDLTEEQRADLTRQITALSQEMAAMVLPIVREALQASLPEIGRQIEQALATGKVSSAQIRAELDRSLAEAQRDLQKDGLSPQMRREVEQILRDVRQEVERAIRAQERAPRRSTPSPAPKKVQR